MSNPIKEYLVSIGLDLNKTKLNQTQKGIKDTTNLIDKMRQASDFLRKGLNGLALSMLGVAGASTKLLTSLAKQDEKFETLAQKMFVTRKSVYEYQLAVKALGTTIDEIQFNPTLMKQYKELVSDSRKMFTAKEYQGAMMTIRSFLFEFVRLKQESMYLLQWIGYAIIKNLEIPLEKARLTLKGLNDYIVKNMSKIGETIGKIIFNVKNFSKSIMDFFGGIIKEIQDFWTSLPPWAKKFIVGTGIIGAIFIGMQNPIIFVSTIISGILLLIDDFQKHINGKKAQFGEFWDNLIKWIDKTKKTIYEWKDNSVKWIENFVSECKKKIPELKTLWENVSKWITENGAKSVNSIVNLIGTLEDFFDRLGFYWGHFKSDPIGFWNKLSTGELDAQFDEQRLARKKAEREGKPFVQSQATENVQSFGNLPPTQKQNNYNPQYDKWDNLINEYANKYGISQNLLKAVMIQESKGDPNTVSEAGAKGLMQLMPETAKDLGVKNPFDPRESLEAGAKYLSQLKKRYNNDEVSMLRAYNWGMGNVDDLNAGRISKSKIPAETVKYVDSITKMLNENLYPWKKSNVINNNASAGKIGNVTPIKQKGADTCGVVSVAMANNAINGNNNLNEDNVLSNYGYNLLSALNGTNKNKNIKWKDLGNKYITDKELNEIIKANKQGLPAIAGVAGDFKWGVSRGHFFVITKSDVKNKKITIVDPATGETYQRSFDWLKKAPQRSDGKGNAVLIPYQLQQQVQSTQKQTQIPRQKFSNADRVTQTTIFNMDANERKRGLTKGWLNSVGNWAKQRWDDVNPFVNKDNIKNINGGSSLPANVSSPFYVGGINITVNTNSNDPNAIGVAVANNIERRMNYFALNRGLGLR